MRKVHTQLASHNLVVVKIADCRCSSVCISEFGEAEAFWLAGIIVVDKSKVKDLTNLAEYVNNLFFGETLKYVNEASYTIKSISNHKEYFLHRSVSRFPFNSENYSPIKTTLPALSAIMSREALSSLVRRVSRLSVQWLLTLQAEQEYRMI